MTHASQIPTAGPALSQIFRYGLYLVHFVQPQCISIHDICSGHALCPLLSAQSCAHILFITLSSHTG